MAALRFLLFIAACALALFIGMWIGALRPRVLHPHMPPREASPLPPLTHHRKISHISAVIGQESQTQAIQITAAGLNFEVGLVAGAGDGTVQGALWHQDLVVPTLVPQGPFAGTQLFAVDGSTVGGRGLVSPTYSLPEPWHAALWNDPGQPPIDLHPQGFYSSQVTCIEGGEQAGFGAPYKTPQYWTGHPLLWHGTSESAVDLIPPGVYLGKVTALRKGIQYGYVVRAKGDLPTAAMWSGSAATYQPINPVGYDGTSILAVSQTDLVGAGIPRKLDRGKGSRAQHALLWSSSDTIDLHPSSASWSRAEGTDGDVQLGVFGYKTDDPNNSIDHACLWQGDAKSFVDLHAILPKGFYTSTATGINGNIITGYGQKTQTGPFVAILWQLS